MFLLVFLLAIPMVKSEPIVLPILNQKEFKACFFDWCQTIAPDWLETDVNFTYANYSYISVYSNYTNISNNTLYCNGRICNYNDSYYLASNPFNFYNATTMPTDDDSAYYLFSNPYNFINNSFNTSYNAQLGHNTTAEIFKIGRAHV